MSLDEKRDLLSIDDLEDSFSDIIEWALLSNQIQIPIQTFNRYWDGNWLNIRKALHELGFHLR